MSQIKVIRIPYSSEALAVLITKFKFSTAHETNQIYGFNYNISFCIMYLLIL